MSPIQMKPMDYGWMKQQAASDFFQVADNEVVPTFLLRNPDDVTSSTEGLEVHNYYDQAGGRFYRIPCAAKLGRECVVCKMQADLQAKNLFEQLEDGVKRVLRPQRRHIIQLVDLRFIKALLQDPAALYAAMEAQGKVQTFEFPHKLFREIAQQIDSAKEKYGRQMDPADPNAAPITWVQKLPKSKENPFGATTVTIDFGGPRFQVPERLVRSTRLYQTVFDEAMALEEWPQDRVLQILRMSGAAPALPGGQQSQPPQVGYQNPGALTYQPPAQPQQPQWQPPTQPAQPQWSPPTPQPPTQSAAALACFGQGYSATSNACAGCGQQGPCLGEIVARRSRATAPASATFTPPPAAPGGDTGVQDRVRAEIARAQAEMAKQGK